MKKPSIKKTNRDTYSLRASREIFKALRYMLGAMSLEDFLRFCKDREQVRQIESLWLMFAQTDMRTSEEAKADSMVSVDEELIAQKLRESMTGEEE